MRGILLTATALACAPAVVSAGPFDLPADTVGLIGDACVTTSLDWPVLFTYAQELATARNLPQVMANDEAAMFGNPAGAHVMFARTSDSFACRIMIP